MNRLFNKVYWLTQIPTDDKNTYFFTTYLGFSLMVRNDGYFNLTYFLKHYTTYKDHNDVYESAKRIFRIQVHDDLVSIHNGYYNDGIYIHWYYLPSVIYMFFPKFVKNINELANINYVHLDITNKIRFLEEKLNYINKGIDHILLMKIVKINNQLRSKNINEESMDHDDSSIYEDFLIKEKNLVVKDFKMYNSIKKTLEKKQMIVLNCN